MCLFGLRGLKCLIGLISFIDLDVHVRMALLFNLCYFVRVVGSKCMPGLLGLIGFIALAY